MLLFSDWPPISWTRHAPTSMLQPEPFSILEEKIRPWDIFHPVLMRRGHYSVQTDGSCTFSIGENMSPKTRISQTVCWKLSNSMCTQKWGGAGIHRLRKGGR